MLVRCVVLHGGNTAKARVISHGWVLAGLEGVDEGRKKSVIFYSFARFFWYLLVVYEFRRASRDASRCRGVLTAYWGTGHVHLEDARGQRAHP